MKEMDRIKQDLNSFKDKQTHERHLTMEEGKHVLDQMGAANQVQDQKE